MKHIPLLFSGPMALANIEGRKTQTRRIVKLRDGSTPQEDDISYHIDGSFDKIMDFSKTYPSWQELKCPYGQPGDVIWQRETHCKDSVTDNYENPFYVYRAGNPNYPMGSSKWTPGIHMPKTAARFFGEITDIRIERIADISEADAIAEGISGNSHAGWGDNECGSAVLAYRSLWNKINGQPSPIQKKVNGKLATTGYVCYPFDEETALYSPALKRDLDVPASAMKTWRGLPLTVIPNPFVFAITYKSIPKPPNF